MRACSKCSNEYCLIDNDGSSTTTVSPTNARERNHADHADHDSVIGVTSLVDVLATCISRHGQVYLLMMIGGYRTLHHGIGTMMQTSRCPRMEETDHDFAITLISSKLILIYE